LREFKFQEKGCRQCLRHYDLSKREKGTEKGLDNEILENEEARKEKDRPDNENANEREKWG